ncbi:MAG: putative ABC transporter permease [Oscillospiraceae bacterium]|nr:putative ABC transporter permease [Oscillospiraceae bacterium]
MFHIPVTQDFSFGYWLFLFFTFSVMGWFLESVVESVNHKRVINRGSLSGPYIPIFGIGGVLFSSVGPPIRDSYSNPLISIALVFFVGALLATALEYLVGSIMERLFKRQFWDYSTMKLTAQFTYKNRISLVSSLFFGVCALFVTFFLYDAVITHARALDFRVVVIVNVVMTAVMGTDIFLQARKHVRIRDVLKKLNREQMREVLLKSMLRMGSSSQIREFRKIVSESRENLKESIKKNTETLKKNIEKNIEKIPRPSIALPNRKADEAIESEETDSEITD